MKITEIQLVGLSTISIPIVGARPTDPYKLVSGDGLGPSGVDVSIALTPNQGAVYQGRRPQLKELVIRLGLQPNFATGQTYSDLRENLYGLLTPGDLDIVTVRLMNGTTVAAITTGYVSKMEATPFSKDPEVQITLECLSQYFYAPSVKQVNLALVTESEPRFTNSGNAPTGFRMNVTFQGSGTYFIIQNFSGTKKMRFDLPIAPGDNFLFDTQPGKREVIMAKAEGYGVFSAIYSLTADSTWLMLNGGVNAFSIGGPAFTFNEISFVPQYWGV